MSVCSARCRSAGRPQCSGEKSRAAVAVAIASAHLSTRFSRRDRRRKPRGPVNAPPTISILAVDDEPGVLALVRRCLDDERLTLTEASSGAEALVLVATGPVLDLLITDLQMPGMEGDELARRVRLLKPGIRVLYLTSHVERLFESKGQLLDEEAFLAKPFSRDGLREAIALLLFGRMQL